MRNFKRSIATAEVAIHFTNYSAYVKIKYSTLLWHYRLPMGTMFS